jgi:hypothetical protein
MSVKVVYIILLVTLFISAPASAKQPTLDSGREKHLKNIVNKVKSIARQAAKASGEDLRSSGKLSIESYFLQKSEKEVEVDLDSEVTKSASDAFSETK